MNPQTARRTFSAGVLAVRTKTIFNTGRNNTWRAAPTHSTPQNYLAQNGLFSYGRSLKRNRNNCRRLAAFQSYSSFSRLNRTTELARLSLPATSESTVKDQQTTFREEFVQKRSGNAEQPRIIWAWPFLQYGEGRGIAAFSRALNRCHQTIRGIKGNSERAICRKPHSRGEAGVPIALSASTDNQRCTKLGPWR